MPLAARQALLEAAREAGVPVMENDAYGELRYSGEPLPALKQLDEQRRHGAAAQLFEDQLSRACGWAGWWGPSR